MHPTFKKYIFFISLSLRKKVKYEEINKAYISFMARRCLKRLRIFGPSNAQLQPTVCAPTGTKTKVFGRFTCAGINGVFSEAQGRKCSQHVCRLADRLNGILNVDIGLERATVDSVNSSGPVRAPGRPQLSV